VRRDFAPDELEKMQQFVEIPVVQRLIELTPVLTAETTREMEGFFQIPARTRQLEERLRRALPGPKLPA
jgi:hypothetical protein